MASLPVLRLSPTAYLGLTVFLLLFAWLVIHRFRLAWLTERAEERSLDDAIAARRAEGVEEVAP